MATNPSFCFNVIFVAIYTLNYLALVFERVEDTQNIVKIHVNRSALKPHMGRTHGMRK